MCHNQLLCEMWFQQKNMTLLSHKHYCREWTFVDGVRMSEISQEMSETAPAPVPASSVRKRKRFTPKNPPNKERKCIADGKEYLSFATDFHVHKPISEEQKKEQQQLQLKGIIR
jgi:hypothetical protein